MGNFAAREISKYSGSTSAENKEGVNHYVESNASAWYRLPQYSVCFSYVVSGWPWESGSGGTYAIYKNGGVVASGDTTDLIEVSSWTKDGPVEVLINSKSTNHGDPGAGYLVANSQINRVRAIIPV